MSAHPPRPPGVIHNLPSHRSIVALTACVITALSTGASAPYLTVSAPEPMRQAPPRPVAVPAVAKVEPDDAMSEEDDPGTPAANDMPAVAKATAAVANAPGVTPGANATPPIAVKPKIELVPDTAPPPTRAKLEDLLPFFVPPSPPASRATYEQK